MTIAVLDKCEVSGIEGFVNLIDKDEVLEVHCSELTDDGDALIIRNTAINEGIEGAFVRISANEIQEVPPAQIVSCIKNERTPIVLEGVTRIVGYYSRTNNWNKSKIGELRDRNQQNYALGGTTPEYDEARHKAINGLS